MGDIINDLSINNSCVQFLCSLPEDTNPLFSKKIDEFINENANLEPMLQYVLKHTSNASLKFNAFYSLMVLYRKQKDVSKAEKIAKKYNYLFKDKPLYLYQMSSIHKKRLTQSDAILSIEYARKAKEQIEMINEEYPGFYHNLADVIALAYENKLISGNDLIEEGIENITKALAIDYNYAKYYCTLGRLQMLEGNYIEAKKNIIHAIDIEDSTRKDFALRISDYQDALVKCSIAQSMNEIENVMSNFEQNKTQLEQELEKMRNSVIEFIGFFAAIVALVLASVQVSVSMRWEDGIKVIGFMIGGIIISFGCLRLILDFSLKTIAQMLLIAFVGGGFILLTFYFVR